MSRNPTDLSDTLEKGNPASTNFANRSTVYIIAFALALSGCAELASLFFIQPLLPKLANEYTVPVTQVSIILSAETALLAFGLLFMGSLSDRFGRKQLIVVALLVGGVLTILCPLATSWIELVALRGLIGLCLSGIAAAATAYIDEEVAPSLAGIVTGYFVFGNSFGGMSGRVLASQVMNIVPLSTIFFLSGAILIAVGIFVSAFLPSSCNFSASKSISFVTMVRSGMNQFKNFNVSLVFIVSFVIFGTFSALYNFLAFHLHDDPFNVSNAQAGLVSTCFLLSVITAPGAGKLAAKYGAMNVLAFLLGIMAVAILLTAWATTAWVFISGAVIFTAAFFGCHAIGFGWVSKNAFHDKGQATALYLFFYYMGGSVVGYLAGLVFGRFGWTGLSACILALLIGAIGVTRIVQRRMSTV